MLLEVEELETLVKDDEEDFAVVKLITLSDALVIDSTTEVVDCSLEEASGSEVILEATLETGPEQAEINKAVKSDKRFFIIKQPYT